MRLPRVALLFCLSILGCATLLVSTDDLSGGGAGPADAQTIDAPGSSTPDAGPVADAPADTSDARRPAPEGSVVWEGSGHAYLVVSRVQKWTWSAAVAEAQARGGHVVTISSAAENAFVFDLLGALGPGAWLGAYQGDGGPEPAGGWTWITGEPMTYTNWDVDQPNNLGGDEDALHFVSDGNGRWSDDDYGGEYEAFVVEFE